MFFPRVVRLKSISILLLEVETDIVDFVEWLKLKTLLASKDESKIVVFTMGLLFPFLSLIFLLSFSPTFLVAW